MDASVTRVSVESGRVKNRSPRAIRVERNGTLTYAESVRVQDGMFVTRPDSPRPYGAYIWFETTEPVIICSDVFETVAVEE